MADVVREVVQACGQRGDNPRQLLDNVPVMLGGPLTEDVHKRASLALGTKAAVGVARHRWATVRARRLEKLACPHGRRRVSVTVVEPRADRHAASGGGFRRTSACAPWA